MLRLKSTIMKFILLLTVMTILAGFIPSKESATILGLNKKIKLLQAQLSDKTKEIRQLQTKNNELKKQISEYAYTQKNSVKSENTASPEYPKVVFPCIKRVYLEGNNLNIAHSVDQFLTYYIYDGKQYVDSQLYLSIDVVQQILGKVYTFDKLNNYVYFGAVKQNDSEPIIYGKLNFFRMISPLMT